MDDFCVPEGCPPGTWSDGLGGCEVAGVAGPCAPGELASGDGVCVPAGVPAAACPAGFEALDRGCHPILPAAPCASGEMTLPGETACRPVADCGEGPWGDIPVEPNTHYVDASFVGISDGSAAAPWTTIQDAIVAVEPDAIVAVAAGTYGKVDIAKPVRLWGRCPSLVTVQTPVQNVAITVIGGADGTLIRGLHLHGSAAGIAVGNATAVGEQLWFTELNVGALAGTWFGVADLTIRDSLFEDMRFSAGVAKGGTLNVERVHARRTENSGAFVAIEAFDDAATNEVARRGELTLVRALVEDAADSGVLSLGGIVNVEATAVLNTVPHFFEAAPGLAAAPDETAGTLGELHADGVYVANAHGAGILAGGAVVDVRHATVVQTQPGSLTGVGHGIHFTVELDDLGTEATVRSSLVDGSVASGVLTADGTTTLEGVVVRNTSPYISGPNAGSGGIGVQLRHSGAATNTSVATIRGCRIEGSSRSGILARGGSLSVYGSLVRATSQDDSGIGAGVVVAGGSSIPPTSLDIEGVLVEQSVGVGLLVAGADVAVRRSTFRDTALASLVPGASSGVKIQHDGVDVGSNASLLLVRVENSRDVGVAVFGSTATLEGCAIVQTTQDDEGRFGDGLLVSSDPLPARLDVNGVLVQDSARAGLASFGATASYARSWFVCQAFDLDGEPSSSFDFSFDDRGGSAAGCDTPNDECVVVTADLEAPTSLSL
jgi:hypothetical protein